MNTFDKNARRRQPSGVDEKTVTTATISSSGLGVYLPDNRDLLALVNRGRGYQPDQAALVLHFVCSKRWLGDADRDGFTRLNAGVLRKWVQSRALSPILRTMTDAGALETTGHSAGRFAKGYRVGAKFDGPPRRWIVTYRPLVRKLAAWRAGRRRRTEGDLEFAALVERRTAMVEAQAVALSHLTLPDTPDALADALADRTDYGHVRYVAQVIQSGDFERPHCDLFGWRLHSIVTRTASVLRARLLLDGQAVAEVDVSCSQPTLLSIMLREYAGYGANALHSGRLSDELTDFCRLCEDGSLYDSLADDADLDRDTAKRALFRDVLFGRPQFNGPLTPVYARRWPRMLDTIRDLKRCEGYKAVSQRLQRLESRIVLDEACGRLLTDHPGIPFLTIHDSILLQAEGAEIARDCLLKAFEGHDVAATVQVRGPPLPSTMLRRNSICCAFAGRAGR